MIQFSVLISVYKKETPEHLQACFESIWTLQTLRPDEIILVQDGELTNELLAVIHFWKKKLENVLHIKAYNNNMGLAYALNYGLRYCNHSYVARMDSDDICEPDRFEKQINFLINNKDIDCLGGVVEEYDADMEEKLFTKIVPLEHEQIINFSFSRNPMSHSSVIFKKSKVIEVGGYPLVYPEDYLLWILMIQNKSKFANLGDVLVNIRGGEDFLDRRGWHFLVGELKINLYMLTSRYIGIPTFLKNVIARTILRISPIFLKSLMYKYFRGRDN